MKTEREEGEGENKVKTTNKNHHLFQVIPLGRDLKNQQFTISSIIDSQNIQITHEELQEIINNLNEKKGTEIKIKKENKNEKKDSIINKINNIVNNFNII